MGRAESLTDGGFSRRTRLVAPSEPAPQRRPSRARSAAELAAAPAARLLRCAACAARTHRFVQELLLGWAPLRLLRRGGLEMPVGEIEEGLPIGRDRGVAAAVIMEGEAAAGDGFVQGRQRGDAQILGPQ